VDVVVCFIRGKTGNPRIKFFDSGIFLFMSRQGGPCSLCVSHVSGSLAHSSFFLDMRCSGPFFISLSLLLFHHLAQDIGENAAMSEIGDIYLGVEPGDYLKVECVTIQFFNRDFQCFSWSNVR
jgi:hypothetical protein